MTQPSVQSSRSSVHSSGLALAALLLLSLALRLPAYFIPHVENDEQIYQTLADKVARDPLDYSLRGTELLAHLPREIYDTPLYERPPLFVFVLAAFRGVLGEAWGILVPVLAGTLTLLATYAVARELYGSELALRSAAIASLCPLLLFCSVRILIEALLVLLVTTTVWLCLVATRKRSTGLFAATGVVLGLTLLTKETGLLVAPVCLFALFREGPRREKARFLVPLALGALATAAPWYLHVYSVLGTFVVWRSSISPEYMERFPFIREIALRPWHFYASNLALCAPVYVLGWIEGLDQARRKLVSTELVWGAAFLLPLTWLGMRGGGYQTRYLLPAVPAFAILAARALQGRGRWLWFAALVFLALGLLTGIMNSLMSKPADLLPLHELVRAG